MDLVSGVHLVQAVDFVFDDPAHAGTMTMTWEATGVEGGTRVEIRRQRSRGHLRGGSLGRTGLFPGEPGRLSAALSRTQKCPKGTATTTFYHRR